jgi:hypothetical protein
MRRNWLKIAFIVILFAVPGSDIECEDDEFEFDWPDIEVEHDHWYHGGYWVAEPVYVAPAPCCWYW